jgi:hypothetical protein
MIYEYFLFVETPRKFIAANEFLILKLSTKTAEECLAAIEVMFVCLFVCLFVCDYVLGQRPNSYPGA